MKAIGVTGGIGAGKSTVGAILRELGIPTMDTDDVAREIVQPGAPALADIRRVFGEEVFDSGDNLNRQALARAVFGHAEARAQLEDILHPRIHVVWQSEMREWQRQGRALGVVIIPLLFEKDLAGCFARTLCVACSEASQLRRLRDRGWREDEIRDRLEAQLPMRRKMELSHYVLWNDSSPTILECQLRQVLNRENCPCPGTG